MVHESLKPKKRSVTLQIQQGLKDSAPENPFGKSFWKTPIIRHRELTNNECRPFKETPHEKSSNSPSY
jgi:hypothetical protein